MWHQPNMQISSSPLSPRRTLQQVPNTATLAFRHASVVRSAAQPRQVAAVQQSTVSDGPEHPLTQQGLPDDAFDVEDLTWVEHVGQITDPPSRKAYIPWGKLPYFIKGEQARGSCSLYDTGRQFRIHDNRQRKLQERSWLFRTTYHCCFGPQDYSQGVPRPAAADALAGKKQRRSARAEGESIRVGCQYRFTVHRTVMYPGTAEVRIFEHQHVNLQQQQVHGPGAQVSNKRLLHDYHLSAEFKAWAEQMIRQGASFTTIISSAQANIIRAVKMQHPSLSDEEVLVLLEHECPREYCVMKQDLQNISVKIQRATFRQAEDDACSVRRLVQEKYPDKVLCYQEQQWVAGLDGKPEETSPFVATVMTDWMARMLCDLGHGAAVMLDTTFGTNKYMFPFFTMLVMDEYHQGVPCAWSIISNEQESTLKVVLRAVRQKVEALRPDWLPNCFMVDDCVALANALRAVWPGVKVELCNWHVKRCWLKNLVQKVREQQDRVDMFTELGSIMYGVDCDLLGANDEAGLQQLAANIDAEVEAFCHRWSQHTAFIDYFKSQWQDRTGMWVVALRLFPHDEQEGTQAMEGFHSGFKATFIRPTKALVGRRLDWLIKTLVDDAEPEYRRRMVLKQHGYVLKSHLQHTVAAALEQAAAIPECLVTVHSSKQRVAVASLSRMHVAHEVLNPNTVWSSCTCERGCRGVVCGHQVRAAMAVSGLDISSIAQRFTKQCVALGTSKPGLINSVHLVKQPPAALNQARLRLDLDMMWQQGHGSTPAPSVLPHSASAVQQQQQVPKQGATSLGVASTAPAAAGGDLQQLRLGASGAISLAAVETAITAATPATSEVAAVGSDRLINTLLGVAPLVAADPSTGYASAHDALQVAAALLQHAACAEKSIHSGQQQGPRPLQSATQQSQEQLGLQQQADLLLTTSSRDAQLHQLLQSMPMPSEGDMSQQRTARPLQSFLPSGAQLSDVRRRSCLEGRIHSSRVQRSNTSLGSQATGLMTAASNGVRNPQSFATTRWKSGRRALKTWEEQLRGHAVEGAASGDEAPAANGTKGKGRGTAQKGKNRQGKDKGKSKARRKPTDNSSDEWCP